METMRAGEDEVANYNDARAMVTPSRTAWALPCARPPLPRLSGSSSGRCVRRPRMQAAAAFVENTGDKGGGNGLVNEKVKVRARERKQNQHDKIVQVELRDVCLSFDGKAVLDGLNLKIYKDECVAIIGVSGTGKSSTLRIISGLTMPSSGEVYLRGRKRTRSITDEFNLNRLFKLFMEAWIDDDETAGKQAQSEAQGEEDEPRVSMVFQNAALLDSLTVGENIELALRYQTDQRSDLSDAEVYDMIKLWLKRVGLADAIYKLPEQLSGGMRKRASFARAVCFNPKMPSSAPDILLYDEPSAGLDPTSSTRIENLINDLRPFCPTSVVVTHQFSTIRRTADRVVFLHKGRTVWDGPVAQLDTTHNPYVVQFRNSSLDGPLIDNGDDDEGGISSEGGLSGLK